MRDRGRDIGRARWARLALLCILGTLLAGCASPPGLPADCQVLDPVPSSATSIRVALLHPVDPHGDPVPRNDSESLVFSVLREPFLDRTCRGRLVASIAESWNEGSGTWEFETDRARDVLDSWRASRRSYGRFLLFDEGAQPRWMWDGIRPRNLTATSNRLEVTPEEPARAFLPGLLANAAFSVPRLGVRLTSSAPSKTTTLSASRSQASVIGDTSAGGSRPTIHFRRFEPEEARDLVPHRTDLLIVRDRAVAEHYSSMAGVRTTPLPSKREYWLLTNWDPLARRIDDAVRKELCQRVVSAEASPFPAIHGRLSRDPVPTDPLHVVFPEFDDDARAIAERIAFLTGEATSRSVVTRESSRHGIESDLRSGGEFAYIVSFDEPTITTRIEELRAMAPWLEQRGAAAGLVVSRAWLVTSPVVPPLRLGSNGLPRLWIGEQGPGLP